MDIQIKILQDILANEKHWPQQLPRSGRAVDHDKLLEAVADQDYRYLRELNDYIIALLGPMRK